LKARRVRTTGRAALARAIADRAEAELQRLRASVVATSDRDAMWRLLCEHIERHARELLEDLCAINVDAPGAAHEEIHRIVTDRRNLMADELNAMAEASAD
jgi:hypothetical protein